MTGEKASRRSVRAMIVSNRAPRSSGVPALRAESSPPAHAAVSAAIIAADRTMTAQNGVGFRFMPTTCVADGPLANFVQFP